MPCSRFLIPTLIRTAIVVTLFAAGLLALLTHAQPAHACSCARSGSPSEAMEHADMVFAGQVSSMAVHRKSPFTFSGDDPVTVEFQVNQVWKGPRNDVLTVQTEWMEISCGYEFEEGGRYIVYAHEGWTGLCTRTKPTWGAIVDFTVLGEGWRPGQPIEQPEVTAPGSTGRGAGCALPARADVGAVDLAFLLLMGMVAGLVVRRPPYK